MSWMDRIYNRAPLAAQNALVSAYGVYWKWLRFGGSFSASLAAYRARERYSPEQWAAWQAERLRELLTLAAGHVPYYRDTWSAAQKQAARAGDLASLPLLEKDPLRADPCQFVREDAHPLHLKHFLTSGSTGTPIETIWTVSELRDSLAVREARSANWAGTSFRLPRATFSGRMVEPDPASRGPFHRFNAAERQVYYSAFHLRPDTAVRYVDALRQHRVEWMTGYAVSFYLLARFILEQGLRVPPLKAVVTTSEKLTPEMRAVMEQAYGCRIYEEYSTVENALFASECEHGRLHVSPDVGAVEILRPDGTPCLPGEPGEVVTTCLMRSHQPLIRYRLGDVAAWDDQPCPCGRSMPVLREVIGRIEDVVVGPDGRQMVRFHGIFTGQPHVREGQIIQERLDLIRVLVVPAAGFTPDDERDIVARMRQRLGNDVQIAVEQVAQIPRTRAGKFQAVISKVTVQH